MIWIEDRLAERVRLVERNRLLRQGAALIYKELYQACSSAVTFYNQRHPEELDRVDEIYRGQEHFQFSRRKNCLGGRQGGSAKVTINLEEMGFFVEHGLRPQMPTFTLGLNSHNGIELRQEGRPIEIAQAVEQILDPVFFPDLPQRFSSKQK